EHRVSRFEKFLNAVVREGCRMVEMSCEDHNRYATGYESLLGLVENTARNSFDLYYGLFMFNKNSLEKLDLAFEDLRKQLIARLHQVLDGSNSHALLRRARNGSALLYSRSNDVAQLSSSASNNSNQFDENTKLKIAILVKVMKFWRILDQTTLMWLETWGDFILHFHPFDRKVLKSLPFQRLKRSTLFVDVLSVKEFLRNLFLHHLPLDFDVFCTHPKFGPESEKNG
ncbi:hypothetical protein S245_049410, partial [Arachis hypogaea]